MEVLKFMFMILVIIIDIIAKSLCDTPPHIIFILVDDLGWSDVGYQNISLISTPNIDRLASEGVILDNYYVQPLCTPTRSALLSGKYPIHTGMQHGVIVPKTPFGLPPELTLLPEKLKQAGYATHIVGKWHIGYYEKQYTPTYRGFDTFYGFYNGAEDHWSHKKDGILDLRDQETPVTDMDNVYSTYMFTERVTKIINSHVPSTPLFLYVPFQNPHEPNQTPKRFTDKYGFMGDSMRTAYAGMVSAVDEAIGNITDALQKKGLWENTLLVFSSDNGGTPIYGGYNWPLRGTKGTLWEGGVRGVGFVHGAMIEKKARKCKELLHVTDWFPTLTSLAGLDTKDEQELDGFNVWSTISKGGPSPRTEILLNIDEHESREPRLAFEGIAIRVGHMKLLLNTIHFPWFKPPELGGTDREEGVELIWNILSMRERGMPLEDIADMKLKGVIAIKEALYNITADPEERLDLSVLLPEVVEGLKNRVDYYRKGVVRMRNQYDDVTALINAQRDGVWGPWR